MSINQTMTATDKVNEHRVPDDFSDKVALAFVKMLRFVADRFFANRYGHRAVVLETVAAVPGMVGGLLQHLRAPRHIRDDEGWIRELLDEAENERMHLMTFVQIAQPTLAERMVIMGTQAVFYNFYFMLYLLAPKIAHRVVAYFEEEAVTSYSHFLAQIDSGTQANVPAPQIAIDYWNLAPNARLREVVLAVRDDEAGHRDRNHSFADSLKRGERPVGIGQHAFTDQA